jgi:hypothetical protein
MSKDTIRETTMINVKGQDVCVAVDQGDGSGPPLLLINGGSPHAMRNELE